VAGVAPTMAPYPDEVLAVAGGLVAAGGVVLPGLR
jgi:hypothetical protein